MMRLPVALLLFLTLAVAGSPARAGEPPTGWIAAGSQPDDYDMGTDPTVTHGGKASGFLRSKGSTPNGFGTLMQMAAPDEYKGQRVRFSGWVKAKNVMGWAGLWLRIDGKDGKPLGFDNMQSRPIKGTQDWTRHEIVLDVPDQAVALAFGVLLHGAGSVWIDDLQFRVVTKDVPVSGGAAGFAPEPPRNLDFEH